MINPMWFYCAAVIDKLSFAIALVTFIAFLLAVIGLGFWITTEEDELVKKAGKKMFFIGGIVGIIGGILLIIVPTSDTLYKMMIAKYCTAENLQLGIEQIQSAVDYIINAVKEIK